MNKVALITGGSSGLGFEMAKVLYAQGYSLVLLARNAEKLKAAKIALEKHRPSGSGNVSVYPCDVSQESDVVKAFGDIKKHHGRIDFLVLNAGIVTIDLLSDYKNITDVTDIIKVNLLGAVSTTYLSLPLLQPGSHVLFISSGFGLVGCAGYSLYNASKAGMNNFADALRRELLPRNIGVHVACPGDIETPMLEAEHRMMPAWIKAKKGRGKPLNAEKAAQYIIKMCFKNRFMIVPSTDVVALVLMQKLLPRRLATFLIDRILPLPPAQYS